MFAVLAENWPTVEVFVAGASQWRYAGMAGFPAGLDLAGVHAAAAALGIAWERPLLERLRVMEAAAVTAFAERWNAREG